MTERKRTGMKEYSEDRAYIMFTMPTRTKQILSNVVTTNRLTYQAYLAELVNNDLRRQGIPAVSFQSQRRAKKP